MAVSERKLFSDPTPAANSTARAETTQGLYSKTGGQKRSWAFRPVLLGHFKLSAWALQSFCAGISTFLFRHCSLCAPRLACKEGGVTDRAFGEKGTGHCRGRVLSMKGSYIHAKDISRREWSSSGESDIHRQKSYSFSLGSQRALSKQTVAVAGKQAPAIQNKWLQPTPPDAFPYRIPPASTTTYAFTTCALSVQQLENSGLDPHLAKQSRQPNRSIARGQCKKAPGRKPAKPTADFGG